MWPRLAFLPDIRAFFPSFFNLAVTNGLSTPLVSFCLFVAFAQRATTEFGWLSRARTSPFCLYALMFLIPRSWPMLCPSFYGVNLYATLFSSPFIFFGGSVNSPSSLSPCWHSLIIGSPFSGVNPFSLLLLNQIDPSCLVIHSSWINLSIRMVSFFLPCAA